MLTCQFVSWKRENIEARVIRKCVRVCVWAHKLLPLAHMTSNINKSSRSFMKVQPPAGSFHHKLSRHSLGVCVNVFLYMCVHVCASFTMSALCALTLGGRENPAIISVHSTAFVIGQSQEFFNSTLAPVILTCHDDRVDKRKHDIARDTQRVDFLIVFTRPATTSNTWQSETLLSLYPEVI